MGGFSDKACWWFSTREVIKRAKPMSMAMVEM
jgi:hypothetical protein